MKSDFLFSKQVALFAIRQWFSSIDRIEHWVHWKTGKKHLVWVYRKAIKEGKKVIQEGFCKFVSYRDFWKGFFELRRYRSQSKAIKIIKKQTLGKTTHYYIEGESRTYIVADNRSRFECQCEDYRWQTADPRFKQNGACKHIYKVCGFLGFNSIGSLMKSRGYIWDKEKAKFVLPPVKLSPEEKQFLDLYHEMKSNLNEWEFARALEIISPELFQEVTPKVLYNDSRQQWTIFLLGEHGEILAAETLPKTEAEYYKINDLIAESEQAKADLGL